MEFPKPFALHCSVSAVAQRLTAALPVAGSIPARSKYFYELRVLVPCMAVFGMSLMFVNERLKKIFLKKIFICKKT